jgi:glucokinase
VCGADDAAQRFSSAAEITAAALAGTDPQAVGTLDLFTTYLGRYAGDLAILFMARGGVCLAGGVTQKIAPLLQRSGFRAAFEDKAPHEAIMADIATVILTHPAAALAGLAAFVRQRKRFRLNLDGRHWHA